MLRLHRLLVVGLILSVFTGAAVLAGAARQAAPAAPPIDTAEGSVRTLKHDGRQRTYVVHDFGRGTPAPVVIVLHGGGGNAESAITMTRFDRVASRDGFIAVYPNGTNLWTTDRFLSWNAGHCCAGAMDARVDDVGFIGALVDALVATTRADPDRVYVTGMSNGGMMAHRLGRELSAKIAAIAPVAGAVFGDEPPPQAPMPAFIVAGAEDQVVPPAGGPLTGRLLLGNRPAADHDVAPAKAAGEYWARANGCGDPVTSETAACTKTEWRVCRSGAPVVFLSVAHNGHAWPGGAPGRARAAPPTQAFDATEAMWAFFRTQSRRHGTATRSSARPSVP
jgi:polyhydroxybutyrate depolymerase